MGLDMYFMNGNEEIYYYRKHADLNGLLEKIWYETTEIPSVNFNCSSLKITNDILEKIEAEADKKVHKKGHRFFFWGESTEEKWADTKNNLIPLLKEHLRKGDTVVYVADW